MKRSIVLGLFFVLFFADLVFLNDYSQAAEPVRTFKPLAVTAPVKLKQFKPVTAVVIKRPLKAGVMLRPIIPAKPAAPTGPDPKAAVDLADMIDDTDLLDDLSETCGWDSHLIFQDKTAGNVFYYLPRVFLLVHNEGTGYGLNVQYNNMTDPEKPSVMLTAELAAPHHSGDILVLKQILKQAFELKPSDKLILKSISGIGAQADLQGISAGLSLAPEQISVTLPSHLKQSFRLTLLLDQDETEEVLAQITREGLTGSLNVNVGDARVPVPIHIQYAQFSGNKVDGFSQWVDNRPTGTLLNITSFPLQMDSINCYRVKNGSLERISKNLKSATLLPERKKAFRLPPADKVLGNHVLLAWLGTRLDSDCTDCIKKVDKQVRKGVAAAPSERIKFEAIPSVFSDYDIYKMVVEVQSPYFNSDGGTVLIREIELTEENNVHQDLVIYTPQGKGAEPLLYKYRLKLITAQGETVLEPQWHDSRSTNRFFGASQLEPVLGEPGDDQ